MVLSEDYDPNAVQTAVSANIQVRAANDLGHNPLSPVKRNAITTTESDERVVMNSNARMVQVNQRTADVRNQQRNRGNSNSNVNVTTGGAEFGVEVNRSFKTSAKSFNEVTPGSVGSAISQADHVKIDPGVGISESELLARMSPEEQEEYLYKKESRKADITSRTPGYVPPQVQTTNLAAHNQQGQGRTASADQRTSNGPRIVARVHSQVQPKTQDGITASVSVGVGSTAIEDAGGGGQSTDLSTNVMEGMTFRNTNTSSPIQL